MALNALNRNHLASLGLKGLMAGREYIGVVSIRSNTFGVCYNRRYLRLDNDSDDKTVHNRK